MKREHGFTLIELLLVTTIMGILASVAIMSMLRSRASANESSAIGTIRTIASAQISYTATCGRGGFAGNLATLGAPPPGGHDGYLAPDLTTPGVVQKSGYRVLITPSASSQIMANDCNGTPTESGYYASAEPLTYGTSGIRAFAMATPNTTIWQVAAPLAPAEPCVAPPPPRP
jgi:prepilin-type N-terminal cleavage/methylation domain-containing protein